MGSDIIMPQTWPKRGHGGGRERAKCDKNNLKSKGSTYSGTNLWPSQYLTNKHAHSHITGAVAAMDKCFALVWAHQHDMAITTLQWWLEVMLTVALHSIGTVTLSDLFILATNRIKYYYSWLQMYCCWSCRFLPAWRLQHLHLWPALQKRQMETSWAGFSSMAEQQCWGRLLIAITHLPTWLLTSTPTTPFLTTFCVKEY